MRGQLTLVNDTFSGPPNALLLRRKAIFQELMPPPGQRIVILTLSRVSDEEIRVSIIPKPLKLTTPLRVAGESPQISVTGSAVVRQALGELASLTLRSAKEQNGRCRQSSKRGSQEINELEIPQWSRQECKSWFGESAGRG